MNLYKIVLHVPESDIGTVQAWAGTQADAKAEAKRMTDEYGEKAVIHPIDFPTDKPSLLAWLNTNFDRDNG